VTRYARQGGAINAADEADFSTLSDNAVTAQGDKK
jgi:hypothetical protein